MNWKIWAQGLAAAAKGGAAGGTAQYTQASGGKVNSGTLVCAGVGDTTAGGMLIGAKFGGQPGAAIGGVAGWLCGGSDPAWHQGC